MKFDLTAKDKLALENLVYYFIEELREREERAKEKEILVPLFGPGSFFNRLGFHRSINWAKDFMNRLQNAKNNQTKKEKELDEKDIIDSGWKEALSI
jgi:hypothetical protein